MNARSIASVLSAVALLGGLSFAPEAAAGPQRTMPRMSAPSLRSGPAMRTPRVSMPSPGRSLGGTSRFTGGSPGRGVSGRLPGMTAPSFGRHDGRGSTGYPGLGSPGRGGLLDALGYGMGGYPGSYGNRGPGYYHYRAQEEMADAYRDAAIVNAVAGLVGVVVQSSVQREALRTAVPAQPVAVAQPAGYYETQRVMVQEGRYESRSLWVPERVDPATGAVIEGHYETHRHYVPPVFEESQVWVPAPVSAVAVTPVRTAAPVPMRTAVPVHGALPPPLPMGVYAVAR